MPTAPRLSASSFLSSASGHGLPRQPTSADVYKGAALFVLYTLALIAWFTTFQVLKDGALASLSVLANNKANDAIATLAN